MHLIDRIGPYLGVVAFLALSVLAVLLFLQAREVRRLREWAGRAPERAMEAAEATGAAAEARGEAAHASSQGAPGFFGRIGAWIGERFGPAYRAADSRSPVDPRIVLGVLVALVIAAGILTGGFGLGGSSGPSSKQAAAPKPGKTEVAVLNGSQEQGVTGQPGLAHTVLAQVVEPAGYRTGAVTNAPHSFPKSVVLYAHGQSAAAAQLATTATKKLGSVKTQPMSSDVRAVVDGAALALVVGVDDASFGS